MTTAKEIALMILALPEEQQNVPLIFEYYTDSESSIPDYTEFANIRFYKIGYPFNEPHLLLEI